jgi:hypothetical protein
MTVQLWVEYSFKSLAWRWIDAASVHRSGDHASSTYSARIGNEFAGNFGR